MSSWCHEPAPPLLRKGVDQLNRGDYFEQHETLEALWNDESRDVRRLYQGILQIGVAMHHVRRGNHHGAMYMLTRGSMYLRPFAPTCQSIDVADLLDQAGRIRQAIDELGQAGLATFDWRLAPRVRFVEPPPPSS